MSTARKAITGAFWLGGVSYVAFGISLIGNIILARLLIPEDFGMFALALALSELLYILSSFSFSQAVIQIQDEENVADMAYILSFALGAMLIVLALGLSPVLVHFYSKKVAILFLALSGAGFISLLAGVYGAQFQKEFEFKRLSFVRLISSSLSVVLAVGMAFYGFGVWSLLAMAVSRSIISFLVYRFASSWRFSWNIDRKILKKLFNFGYRMFFLRSLEIAYTRLDRLVIGTLGNTIMLGFYHQARYLADLGNVATAPGFFQVSFPTYAKYQKDNKRLSETYKIVNYFLVRIMGFFLLTFVLFPKELISLLYGQKWIEAAPALQMFSIYAFFVPIFENMKALLIGKGQISEAAKARFFQVGSLIPLLILGILWKGLEGAVAATSLAMVIGVAGGFYYIKKFCIFSFREIYLKPLVVICVTALIFGFIKSKLNVQMGGLMTIAYIIILNLTYALLLLAIENNKLIANIKLILNKLKEREALSTGDL